MICGVFTPLAKIFQPSFRVYTGKKDSNGNDAFETVTTADLIRNPDRIQEPEQFSITIPRSVGAVAFRFGRVRTITDPDLYLWLTGGDRGDMTPETHCYGVVQVPLAQDDVGVAMAAAADDEDEELAVIQRLKARAREAKEIAKQVSEDRVMRQIRSVFMNLKRERLRLKEEGSGEYQPSQVEILCTIILSKENAQLQEERKRAMDLFEATFSKATEKV